MRLIRIVLLGIIALAACTIDGAGEVDFAQESSPIYRIDGSESLADARFGFFGQRKAAGLAMTGNLELHFVDETTAGLLFMDVELSDVSIGSEPLPDGLQLRRARLHAGEVLWCSPVRVRDELYVVELDAEVELTAELLLPAEEWAAVLVPLSLSMEIEIRPGRDLYLRAWGRRSAAQPTFPISVERLDLRVEAKANDQVQ